MENTRVSSFHYFFHFQNPKFYFSGPQAAAPQAGYGGSWNWNMSQSGPVAGQTAASQSNCRKLLFYTDFIFVTLCVLGLSVSVSSSSDCV